MPIFTIYQNGKQIEVKSFKSQFYIIKELETFMLFWEADEEQKPGNRGGEIHIWVQSSYRLPFVRPDWRLTIDNIQFPQKLYQDVDLTGKCIRLQYDEYEFVCQFPEASRIDL